MTTQNVLGQIDAGVLGGRLAAARMACGLSQQFVADALGLARSTVSDLERGKRRIRPRELIQFARLCEIPVGSLIQPDEPQHTEHALASDARAI